jgi:predicted transcriptional regulator
MRRSKLEICIDVLKVLAARGPLKPTHIMYKANVNRSLLKWCLDLLVRQNLVEERRRGERTVYAITDRGIAVLNYFKELKTMLPIVEEAGVSTK